MSSGSASQYAFDRFLRHDELVAWLDELAVAHPDLVELETYGRSHEGRELLLVTVTDASTGAHDTKPAHWVDASIHAVELTATVAACHLLQRLVDGFAAGDETIVRALRTRTFYVVPRVNPDGAEWALAESPRLRRSSVRPWPDPDAHRWPGLHAEDIDGDGRILQMRLADPHGAWTVHPDDDRLLVPIPPAGTAAGRPRYRLLTEGSVDCVLPVTCRPDLCLSPWGSSPISAKSSVNLGRSEEKALIVSVDIGCVMQLPRDPFFPQIA